MSELNNDVTPLTFDRPESEGAAEPERAIEPERAAAESDDPQVTGADAADTTADDSDEPYAFSYAAVAGQAQETPQPDEDDQPGAGATGELWEETAEEVEEGFADAVAADAVAADAVAADAVAADAVGDEEPGEDELGDLAAEAPAHLVGDSDEGWVEEAPGVVSSGGFEGSGDAAGLGDAAGEELADLLEEAEPFGELELDLTPSTASSSASSSTSTTANERAGGFGHPEVDAAVERLAELDHLETPDHIEVFEDAHRRLHETLLAAGNDATGNDATGNDATGNDAMGDGTAAPESPPDYA